MEHDFAIRADLKQTTGLSGEEVIEAVKKLRRLILLDGIPHAAVRLKSIRKNTLYS